MPSSICSEQDLGGRVTLCQTSVCQMTIGPNIWRFARHNESIHWLSMLPVKQEVNSTKIPPPLLFPEWAMFSICTAMSGCYDRFPNVIPPNDKCPKTQDTSSGKETILSSAMTIHQMSKRQKTSGPECEFLLFQKKKWKTHRAFPKFLVERSHLK